MLWLWTKVKAFYLLLVICVVLVLYAGMANLWHSGSMFARKINGRVLLTDFLNHYNAGLLSRRCLSERVAIYDPAVQAASEAQLTAPLKPELPFYLQYPPYFFALALPLSFTSISVAFVIWSAVGAAGLYFCIWYLVQQTSFNKFSKTLAVASVFMSFPTWLSFGMGQTALFNFTAIVLSLCLLQKRRPILSGLVASLVSIKLQYAPVMGMIGLMIGGLPFVAGFAAGMAILVSYATAVVGWQNVIAFPQALLMGETSKNVSGVSPITMQNFRGYLTLLFHDTNTHLVSIISAAIFVVGLAVISWMWWQLGKQRKDQEHAKSDTSNATDDTWQRRFKWTVALTFPIMMLTSLHTHVYDYVMMSVPCILLWDLIANKARTAPVLTLRALIMCFPALSWLMANYRQVLNDIYLQPATLWALTLLTLALYIYRQERLPVVDNKPETTLPDE